MKKILVLKKILTWKKVMIAVAAIAIIAVLAVFAVSIHDNHSPDRAARDCLQQLVLTEICLCSEAAGRVVSDCPDDFFGERAFTDGVSETMEKAVERLIKCGFRPDPSIAFHVMRPAAVSYKTCGGFIAFAAHNSVGSTVYVYDSRTDRNLEFREAHENDTYGGVTLTSSAPALYCYKYDPANTAAPVEKNPNSTIIAPDPNDKYPARMVVTVAAE